MKRTVAYCRTAFAEPSDPLAGVSAQAASLREYAGQHGMTVDGTYLDAGVSGMTLIRPALQQLLADCRAGKIGVVLTTDTDRFSRDTIGWTSVRIPGLWGACEVRERKGRPKATRRSSLSPC